MKATNGEFVKQCSPQLGFSIKKLREFETKVFTRDPKKLLSMGKTSSWWGQQIRLQGAVT
jgi:hypothetical protein